MKISELLAQGKITISCELFPPKQIGELSSARTVVAQTAALRPSFMSVTYGAGGTTRDCTVELADDIQNRNDTVALAHLTCIRANRASIRETLAELQQKGVENILALRGDIPSDLAGKPLGDYEHASDLAAEIRSFGGFCVGGACYPEGHPESRTLTTDIDNLRRKVDAGCEFLTTQMFFDNSILYSFMYRLLKSGINVPVIAGIMPVINASQITRICSLSGTKLPPRFCAVVDTFIDDPAAMKQAGIAYATEQIVDLIANGVRNIHIYTMNKPEIAGKIIDNLSDIFIR